jgi:hypothetical protein
MDLKNGIKGLSDVNAADVLQRLVKSLVTNDPQLLELIQSEAAMRDLARDAAQRLLDTSIDVDAVPSTSDPKLVKDMLLAFADDPVLSVKLQNVIAARRDVLFDPITSAIVLAGIVLVLSTHVEIEVGKDKQGKKHWKVKIEKKATPPSILKKFFGLFK